MHTVADLLVEIPGVCLGGVRCLQTFLQCLDLAIRLLKCLLVSSDSLVLSKPSNDSFEFGNLLLALVLSLLCRIVDLVERSCCFLSLSLKFCAVLNGFTEPFVRLFLGLLILLNLAL